MMTFYIFIFSYFTNLLSANELIHIISYYYQDQRIKMAAQRKRVIAKSVESVESVECVQSVKVSAELTLVKLQERDQRNVTRGHTTRLLSTLVEEFSFRGTIHKTGEPIRRESIDDQYAVDRNNKCREGLQNQTFLFENSEHSDELKVEKRNHEKKAHDAILNERLLAQFAWEDANAPQRNSCQTSKL